MSILSKPYMYDEAKAFEHIESMVWPLGPTCLHCGNRDNINFLKCVRSKPSKKNPKGDERHGLKKCPKKGISSHQLHRVLEITYKSAWFMTHRIREAMQEKNNTDFGSGGGAVEVDETFIGPIPSVQEV